MPRVAHYTVIETRTHSQQNVAILHAQVGFVSAVHAGHADKARVRRGESTQSHECGGAGCSDHIDQLHQLVVGIGGNDAAANVDHGPLSRQQHLYGFFDLALMSLGDRCVRTHLDFATPRRVLAGGHGDVLGDINQNGPRPASTCDVESATHGLGEIFNIAHQEIVFDAGAGNAHRVTFLESVLANGGGGYLPAQDHHGDGVHIGSRNAGHSIGNTRATGNQGHANFVGGTGICISCVDGRLFVAHQHVLEVVLLVDCVVDIQHCAAGIAEHVV